MLSRDQRLNLKTSFNFVVKGQKFENSLYKIFFRPGDLAIPKVGIALKKEYFKLATERNRARRLTATAISALYSGLKEKTNLILMPKRGVIDKSPLELEEFLKKTLSELKLLN